MPACHACDRRPPPHLVSRSSSELIFAVAILALAWIKLQARSGKTLVFAADGASADAVCQVLAGGDVPHVVYHKSRPMGEQAAALAALREQPGCVMVCTDAAARGLDVEDIKHVVQVRRSG